MNIIDLEKEYQKLAPSAAQFGFELSRQLAELLNQHGVSLGFPIQQRVKAWASIADKIERKSLDPKSISHISDLIGIRIIVLFQRDANSVCELIKENFKVLQQENAQDRLGTGEFGYSSVHFHIELKPDWLAIPTLKTLLNLKAEIQVRTMAQHIWAASSHILQYKKENGVPPPVRRSIYRVSALLETVDLEFERVLASRDEYVTLVDTSSSSEELNVDLVAKILNENLPAENTDGQEPYDELLEDLVHFSISTPRELVQLLKKHSGEIIEADKIIASEQDPLFLQNHQTDRIRRARGVFFNHVGLVRQAMSLEFGAKWVEYFPIIVERNLEKRKSKAKAANSELS